MRRALPAPLATGRLIGKEAAFQHLFLKKKKFIWLCWILIARHVGSTFATQDGTWASTGPPGKGQHFSIVKEVFWWNPMHEDAGSGPWRGPCDRHRWRGPPANSDPEQTQTHSPSGEGELGQTCATLGERYLPREFVSGPSGLWERG